MGVNYNSFCLLVARVVNYSERRDKIVSSVPVIRRASVGNNSSLNYLVADTRGSSVLGYLARYPWSPSVCISRARVKVLVQLSFNRGSSPSPSLGTIRKIGGRRCLMKEGRGDPVGGAIKHAGRRREKMAWAFFNAPV